MRRRHHDFLLHHPAGRIFGVGQTFLNNQALCHGHGGKNFITFFGLEFLQDINNIITVEFGQRAGHTFGTDNAKGFFKQVFIDKCQRFRVKHRPDHDEKAAPLCRVEPLNKVSLIRRVKRCDKRPHPLGFTFGQRGDDGSPRPLASCRKGWTATAIHRDVTARVMLVHWCGLPLMLA